MRAPRREPGGAGGDVLESWVKSVEAATARGNNREFIGFWRSISSLSACGTASPRLVFLRLVLRNDHYLPALCPLAFYPVVHFGPNHQKPLPRMMNPTRRQVLALEPLRAGRVSLLALYKRIDCTWLDRTEVL